MAAAAPDSNEDLVMMRIIGDPREGEPGRDFLVAEGAANDLHACFKPMMLLRKVIQKGSPVCLRNVLGHRVSPSIITLVTTVMGRAEPGSPLWLPAPCAPAACREQVLCQCSSWPHTACLERWSVARDISSPSLRELGRPPRHECRGFHL